MLAAISSRWRRLTSSCCSSSGSCDVGLRLSLSLRLSFRRTCSMLCCLLRIDLAKVSLFVPDEKVEADESLGTRSVRAMVGGDGVVVEAMAREVIRAREGCLAMGEGRGRRSQRTPRRGKGFETARAAMTSASTTTRPSLNRPSAILAPSAPQRCAPRRSSAAGLLVQMALDGGPHGLRKLPAPPDCFPTIKAPFPAVAPQRTLCNER